MQKNLSDKICSFCVNYNSIKLATIKSYMKIKGKVFHSPPSLLYKFIELEQRKEKFYIEEAIRFANCKLLLTSRANFMIMTQFKLATIAIKLLRKFNGTDGHLNACCGRNNFLLLFPTAYETEFVTLGGYKRICVCLNFIN